MTISDRIKHREINEILHFTTNQGLLGVLHTRLLKSKARLRNDKQLEFILKPNAPVRKDPAWLDYVNLSITNINSTYFSISSNNWHAGEDLWWCVLAFSPEILTDDGVVFTTANNIWPATLREAGETGLEKMFADPVLGYYSAIETRSATLPLSCPTSEQAEVLYPGEIGTDRLSRIYVRTHDEADQVSSQLAVMNHRDVEVVVSKQMFQKR